jgi:hypothetical protein
MQACHVVHVHVNLWWCRCCVNIALVCCLNLSLCAASISSCVCGSNGWMHAFRRGKRDWEEERGTLLEG